MEELIRELKLLIGFYENQSEKYKNDKNIVAHALANGKVAGLEKALELVIKSRLKK